MDFSQRRLSGRGWGVEVADHVRCDEEQIQ